MSRLKCSQRTEAVDERWWSYVGLPPQCYLTFTRYIGPEQGRTWVARMQRMTDRIARITVRPNWVDILDFETRFPSGMTRRMGLVSP
jgi:hypothetical protein